MNSVEIYHLRFILYTSVVVQVRHTREVDRARPLTIGRVIQPLFVINAEATSGHSQRFLPVGIIIHRIVPRRRRKIAREATGKVKFFKQE